VTKEFGDDPKVWEIFNKTLEGVRLQIGTATGKVLDPRPLIDGIAAEYGPRGGLLAVRMLEEINALVFTSPWSSVSRQDFDSVIPLRDLFGSEELPSALGMFFDQRFIDFLHANLDEVGTMHWRQFEGESDRACWHRFLTLVGTRRKLSGILSPVRLYMRSSAAGAICCDEWEMRAAARSPDLARCGRIRPAGTTCWSRCLRRTRSAWT
jgi:hypothetical protein